MQSLLVASAARQVAGLETATGLYKGVSRAVPVLRELSACVKKDAVGGLVLAL